MSYTPEWIILVGGGALVVALCSAPLAMIAFGTVLFAVLVALVALAVAILATPYLLVRFVRRRHQREVRSSQ